MRCPTLCTRARGDRINSQFFECSDTSGMCNVLPTRDVQWTTAWQIDLAQQRKGDDVIKIVAAGAILPCEAGWPPSTRHIAPTRHCLDARTMVTDANGYGMRHHEHTSSTPLMPPPSPSVCSTKFTGIIPTVATLASFCHG